MLKGLLPSTEDLLGKVATGIIAVPEGIIMLAIAVIFDFLGIFLFVLSLVGVGIPISWLLDFTAGLIFGTWIFTRHLFRGTVRKAVGEVGKMTRGAELPETKETAATTAAGQEMKKMGRVAKGSVGAGLSLARFGIAGLIEIVPYLGDVFPSWTLLVIFELVSSEVLS